MTLRFKIAFKQLTNLKINCIFHGRFEALIEDEIAEERKHLQTRNHVILRSSDLSDWYEQKK